MEPAVICIRAYGARSRSRKTGPRVLGRIIGGCIDTKVSGLIGNCARIKRRTLPYLNLLKL